MSDQFTQPGDIYQGLAQRFLTVAQRASCTTIDRTAGPVGITAQVELSSIVIELSAVAIRLAKCGISIPQNVRALAIAGNIIAVAEVLQLKLPVGLPRVEAPQTESSDSDGGARTMSMSFAPSDPVDEVFEKEPYRIRSLYSHTVPALRTCRAGWDDSVSVSDLDTLKFINALIDHLESARPLPGFTCQTFDPLVMAAFRSVK